MEAQAYLIGAAVVIISAIIIYLIAAVTMREKSYDDILAEQRKRREELFTSTGQADKNKAKKKTKKKVQRERSDVTTDGNTSVDEVDRPQKMVELELEPQVIEDAPKSAKSAKVKKQKTILINKQEKVVVRETMTAPEAPHYRPTPKDAVALKQERERKISETKVEAEAGMMMAAAAPEVSEKVRKREKKKRDAAMPEAVAVENIQMTEAPITTAKEQRRAKKAKEAQASTSAGAERVQTDGVEVISTVQAARLNNADIQTLIEVLLGKQGGSTEPTDSLKWRTKSPKGDPVELLERQLVEKNNSLKEEQEQAQVALRRLKEVQQELTREHHQYALLENESKEKMAAQLQDIQALQLRMQQTHEQHRVEVTRLKMQLDQRQGQMNDNQVVLMQRVKEENMQLKDKANSVQTQLKIVQDELSKQIKERGSVDGNRKIMESKLMQYEDKIHKLETSQRDTENVLTQKYKEVSEHLQREQGKSSTLVRDLDKANTERHHRDQELSNMRNRMKDLENVKSHRDQELHDLQIHLQNIQEENTTLITELKTYRERTSGEGQEAPTKPQGAVAQVMEEPKQEQNTLLRSEHDHILNAKDMEINQLKADLEGRLAELSHLQPLAYEVETLKKKNNDLRQKNWKAMDALSEMEKMAQSSASLKTQLQSKDNEITKLIQELSQLQNHNSDLEVEKSKALADTIAAGRNATVANEQLDQLKLQLETKSAELTSVTASLTSLTQDHDVLQSQVNSLESSSKSAAAEELSQLQLSLQAQSELLLQKEETIKIQEEKFNQCQSQLQSQTDKIHQSEKEAQSHKEQLNSKIEQLESLNKQLKDNEELIQSHSVQLAEKESLLKSYTEQQSQDQDLELKTNELQGREAALKQQVDQLGARESELEQQKQQLDQTLQQLKDQEEAIKNQSEQLRTQESTLETRLQTTRDREASLEEQTQKLKALESQLQQQQQDIQEKQQQLEQAQTSNQEENEARQTMSEALKSELDSLKKENEELKVVKQSISGTQSRATATTAVSEANSELNQDEEATEIMNMGQMLDAANTASDKSQQELLFFKEELHSKNTSAIELRDELNSVKERMASLQEELLILQNASSSSEQRSTAEINSLKSELQTKVIGSENLMLEVDRLQRNLEKMQSQTSNDAVRDQRDIQRRGEEIEELREELRSERSASADKLEAHMDVVNILKQDIATFKFTIANLEASLAEEIENSKMKILSKDNRIKSLEGELKDLHDGSKSLEEHVKQDAERMKMELNEATVKVDSLEHELVEMKRSANIVSAELQGKSKHVDELQIEILTLIDSMKEAENQNQVTVDRLEADCKDKSEALQKLQDELLQSRSDMAKAAKQFSFEKENLLCELKEQTEHTEKANTELMEKVITIEKLQAKVEALKSSEEALQRHLNETCQTQAEQMESLKLSFASTESTMREEAKMSAKEIEAKIVLQNTMEQDIANLKVTVSNLEASLAEEIENSKMKILSKDNRIKSLEGELKDLHDGSKSLEEHVKQDSERMKMELNEAALKVDSLEHELVQMKRSANVTSAELQRKSNHIDDLQVDVLTLINSKKEAENQNQRTVDKLEAECKDKANALQKLQDESIPSKPEMAEAAKQFSSEEENVMRGLTVQTVHTEKANTNLKKDSHDRIMTGAEVEEALREKASVTVKQHMELQEKSTQIEVLKFELQELKSNNQPMSDAQLKLQLEEKSTLLETCQLLLAESELRIKELKEELLEAGTAVDQPGITELNTQIDKMKLTTSSLEADLQERINVTRELESELLVKTKAVEDLKGKLQKKDQFGTGIFQLDVKRETDDYRDDEQSKSARILALEDELLKMKMGQADAENEVQLEIGKLTSELKFKVTSLHIAEEELQKLQSASTASEMKLQEFEKAKADLESKSAVVLQLQQELDELHKSSHSTQNHEVNYLTSKLGQKSIEMEKLQAEVSNLKVSLATSMEENEKLQAMLNWKLSESGSIQQESDTSVDSGFSSSHTEVHSHSHTTLIQREIIGLSHSQPSDLGAGEFVSRLQLELTKRDKIISDLQQKLDAAMTTASDSSVIQGNESLMRDIETKHSLIKSLSNEKKTLEKQIVILDDASKGAQRLKDMLQTKSLEVESLQNRLDHQKSSDNQDIVQSLQEELQKHQQITAENQLKIKSLSEELDMWRKRGQDDVQETAREEQTNRMNELMASEQETRQQCDMLKHELSMKQHNELGQNLVIELQEKVNQLLHENDELRLGCEQATVALTKAEQSAEEIAQVQSKLATKMTEVHELRASLQKRDKELRELQEANTSLAHQVTSSPPTSPTSDGAGPETVRKEVTVFTHVQEKTQWDMSGMILDLQTKDAELQILQELLAQKERALQHLQKEKVRTTQTLSELQEDLQARDIMLKDLHTKLEHSKTKTSREELPPEMPTANDQTNDLLMEIVNLQAELQVQAKINTDLQERMDQTSGSQKTYSVSDLEWKLQKKDDELVKLRDTIKYLWTENHEIKEQFNNSIGGSTQESAEFEMQVLRSEIAAQKSELNELRQKNWKAMEAVSQAEKREQGSSSAAGELAEMRASLQKLFPQVQITESSTWLVNMEEHLKQQHRDTTQQSTSDDSELNSKLEESIQSNSRLEGQVQHYKAVLADTESILNKLQSSVESEEQKWILKLQKSEAELKKATSENSNLSEQIRQLDSNKQTSAILSEMEQKLSAAENENLDLQSQISESSISLNSVKADLEDYRHSSLSDNVQEAENIKLELEDSLKKLKQMKSANVKLTGQLKIGQEALRQEQEEVKKLKDQVEFRRKSLTNGSPVHHESEDVEKLTNKLATMQKQLDKEVQTSQQLMTKLGASAESESTAV